MLVGFLYAFLTSNMTFIVPNLHQKTDSKAQQPRNKSKELNGWWEMKLNDLFNYLDFIVTFNTTIS